MLTEMVILLVMMMWWDGDITGGDGRWCEYDGNICYGDVDGVDSNDSDSVGDSNDNGGDGGDDDNDHGNDCIDGDA